MGQPATATGNPKVRRRIYKLLCLALILLTLALVLPAPTPAAVYTGDGGWVWQTPAPQIETLRAVVFVGDSEAWAAGDGGTLLRTADVGKTWSTQASGTDASLRGLSFADAECGWAVGTSLDDSYNPVGNVILATSDGGLTWHQQDAGVQSGLNAVSFVDRARGWAVGDAGTVLRTVDGGATWQSRGSGTTKKLLAVSFASAARGWAVGAQGAVLRTIDGGRTWRAQHSGTRARLTGVSFVDARHGWAVGFASTSSLDVVLATADGGATWHRRELPSWFEPLAVSFSDRRHGMVAGWASDDVGLIMATADGGAHWKERAGEPQTLEAIDLTGRQRALAVGAGGLIVSTGDGGATWKRRDSGTSTLNYDISFCTRSTAGSSAICRTAPPGSATSPRRAMAAPRGRRDASARAGRTSFWPWILSTRSTAGPPGGGAASRPVTAACTGALSGATTSSGPRPWTSLISHMAGSWVRTGRSSPRATAAPRGAPSTRA